MNFLLQFFCRETLYSMIFLLSYMETTKLSVKGQIVLTKNLREEMNWKPGDVLEIATKGDLIILKKIEKSINGKDLKGI